MLSKILHAVGAVAADAATVAASGGLALPAWAVMALSGIAAVANAYGAAKPAAKKAS